MPAELIEWIPKQVYSIPQVPATDTTQSATSLIIESEKVFGKNFMFFLFGLIILLNSILVVVLIFEKPKSLGCSFIIQLILLSNLFIKIRVSLSQER